MPGFYFRAKTIENPFKAPAQKSGEPSSSKTSSSSSSTKDPRKPQVGEKRSALDEIMEVCSSHKEILYTIDQMQDTCGKICVSLWTPKYGQ